MKKNEKIYLAGYKGLVGSHIYARLKEEGLSSIIISDMGDFDLRRQVEVENFFEKEKPEYVFLAAAHVGGILANNTYKAEFIYDNMMIAANVINTAYKTGIKKLLNLGSSCIYPKLAPQPMKEEHLLTGVLEQTNEPYAIAKISAIKLCRYYNEQYGTNYISVMPTNLYGPADNFNIETGHVLPALMRKFHLAKLLKKKDTRKIKNDLGKYKIGFGLDKEFLNGRPFDELLKKIGISGDAVFLWGSGSPFREFLFVEDLADACVFLMQKYDFKDIGEFINIGTGKDITIKELAELVKDIVGFEGDIKYDLTKPDGTPKKLLDVSRMERLGWRAKTGLKEGLTKMYNWYLQYTEAVPT